MVKRKIFYGWFIVAISLVMMTVAYGVYYSWPVFYVAILGDFGWSRAGTAIIFSIASSVYAFASPVSGFLFDKFGPRKLFITAALIITIGVALSSQATEIWQLCLSFGFLVGFGTISTGFVPHIAMIANWFEKKRVTASGIAQMGSRDSFLLAPLIQLTILALGWQQAYLILALAVVVTIIPLSLLLHTKPGDMGLLPDGKDDTQQRKDIRYVEAEIMILDTKWASTKWTLVKAIKTYQFFAFCLIMVGAGFSTGSLINHFVALVTDLGFSAMFAAGLLAIYAITAVSGRCCAFISDLIARDTSTPWMLYIFIAFFGLGSGLYGPTYAASIADLFQGSRFGTIIGFANIGYGLGAAIGTWLYGYLFDTTGTYTLAVGIVMLAICLMCVSIWIAAPRKVRRIARKGIKI